MKAQADYYILHEHLETVNVPMYFHEFAALAKASGLQFLAEAELGAMSMQGLSADIRNIVRQLSKDLVDCEQYVDFIRNRTFRRTLLCRGDVTLDWRSQAKRIHSLYVASSALAGRNNRGRRQIRSQVQAARRNADHSDAVDQSDADGAHRRWPQAMHFEQLLDEAMRRINLDPAASKTQREQFANYLAENLILCLSQRAVMFYTAAPPIASAPGSVRRPLRCPGIRRPEGGAGDLAPT